MDKALKILVLSQVIPWPETSGARIRLSNVLRGLSRLGAIDLFCVPGQDTWEMPTVPDDTGVRRLDIVQRPIGDFSLSRRLHWLVAGRLPSHFVGRDYGPTRARYRDWQDGPYDLVWFNHLKSYAPFRAGVHGPAIVDFDDLEDSKIEDRLVIDDSARHRGVSVGLHAAHRVVSRIQDAKNASLWRRLQGDAVRSVRAVVVCSDRDCRRLGVANAFVIPNGYTYQPQPVGRGDVGTPPTVVFPGFLRYRANIDAAVYLVEEIAPMIRTRLPGVQVRVVGDADHRVVKLHRPPETIVTGFVKDIKEELARADMIAVPIRMGGGTRIKILEGFAHRIPVVSTSKGAEGIEASDGREILLGDTPARFADACVKLLTDVNRRRALVDAAHALFLEKYRWDRIHERVSTLARRVAGGSVAADGAAEGPHRPGGEQLRDSVRGDPG